jgi:hypothetical protein
LDSIRHKTPFARWKLILEDADGKRSSCNGFVVGPGEVELMTTCDVSKEDVYIMEDYLDWDTFDEWIKRYAEDRKWLRARLKEKDTCEDMVSLREVILKCLELSEHEEAQMYRIKEKRERRQQEILQKRRDTIAKKKALATKGANKP